MITFAKWVRCPAPYYERKEPMPQTETTHVTAESMIAATEAQIISLLISTKREGITYLITYLEETGFFTSPASTKFHGAYRGGLAKHSLRVYELLDHFWRGLPHISDVTATGQKPLSLDRNNIIIAALLHDVCKMGAYLGDEMPYKWNKSMPQGHAMLSIARITKNIRLEPIERMMIRYHMGLCGCHEYYEPGSWEDRAQAEYNIRSIRKGPKPRTKEEKEHDKATRYGQSLRNAYYHNPIVKFIYFADEAATAEERTGE